LVSFVARVSDVDAERHAWIVEASFLGTTNYKRPHDGPRRKKRKPPGYDPINVAEKASLAAVEETKCLPIPSAFERIDRRRSIVMPLGGFIEAHSYFTDWKEFHHSLHVDAELWS
jgi:hypothetical protein